MLAIAIPQLGRLEDLPELKDLKLTSAKIEDPDSLVLVEYEAVASPSLYPNVRARLIDRNVIKKDDVRNTIKRNKDRSLIKGYEQLVLDFYRDKVQFQVWLKVFNPNYKADG